MMIPDSADPRPIISEATDIRPVIGRASSGTPKWLPILLVMIFAIALFALLENQRRARAAPTTSVRISDQVAMPASLPSLHLPLPVPLQDLPPPPPPGAPSPQSVRPAMPSSPVQSGIPSYSPPAFSPPSLFEDSPASPSYVSPGILPAAQIRGSAAETLIIDSTRSPASSQPAAVDQRDESNQAGTTSATAAVAATGAASSRQLGRRAGTVPQGTLIPAVLETALDSTRPGFVRAIVARDVYGADGSRVLIPRGSRLFGNYEADLGAGQDRAMVKWMRLVRPDGLAIDIDSPAADRVGRAGVRGRVDNHFLERLGSVVLHTTLNLGSSLAGRSLGGDTPLIVALPGAASTLAAPALSESRIQPTLKVDAGATVTVFVARDLDLPLSRTSR